MSSALGIVLFTIILGSVNSLSASSANTFSCRILLRQVFGSPLIDSEEDLQAVTTAYRDLWLSIGPRLKPSQYSQLAKGNPLKIPEMYLAEHLALKESLENIEQILKSGKIPSTRILPRLKLVLKEFASASNKTERRIIKERKTVAKHRVMRWNAATDDVFTGPDAKWVLGVQGGDVPTNWGRLKNVLQLHTSSRHNRTYKLTEITDKYGITGFTVATDGSIYIASTESVWKGNLFDSSGKPKKTMRLQKWFDVNFPQIDPVDKGTLWSLKLSPDEKFLKADLPSSGCLIVPTNGTQPTVIDNLASLMAVHFDSVNSIITGIARGKLDKSNRQKFDVRTLDYNGKPMDSFSIVVNGYPKEYKPTTQIKIFPTIDPFVFRVIQGVEQRELGDRRPYFLEFDLKKKTGILLPWSGAFSASLGGPPTGQISRLLEEHKVLIGQPFFGSSNYNFYIADLKTGYVQGFPLIDTLITSGVFKALPSFPGMATTFGEAIENTNIVRVESHNLKFLNFDLSTHLP